MGNLVKTADPNLNVTKFEYDAADRKINSIDGEGKQTDYRYDGVGNLVGQTDPNGNEISHTYDKLNRRIASYDSVGKFAAWDYDGDGNLLSETDANGNSTTHDYNELGQRTTTRQPEGRTLTFEADLMGNRTGLTDGRGNKTSYEYDRLNRVTLSKDANGGTHIFEYDKVGNKTKETDPLGHSTTTQYDALNRPVLVTDALGQTVKFEYDANGNKVKETDKRGIVTTHVYDKVDRLTSSTRDGQVLLKQEYDRNGNVLVATDANNNATSYSYDRRNLRTSENRLLAAITRFELDSVGDVAKVTDPEGRQTVNTHDSRRRLTSVTNALGQTTAYEYDGVGNRTRVVHPLGNAATSTYDAANRLKTVSDAAGTHTYGYDKADNHVSYLDALNNETRYDYDVLNRRTGVRYPDGASESFVYDAAGNMGSHTDGNGTVITRTFDAINRETTKHYSASEDGFTDIATGYDANNNVVTVEQKGGSTRTSSYTFDRFDRQITHTDAFGAKISSTYDANGNKLSTLTQDGQVTRYGYDVLNRLTSVVGKSGVTSYSYDRSSLETRIDYNNGVASVFNYDKAGRVSSVLHQKGGSNLSRTDYEYDSNGNRKKETINRVAGAQVTSYDYDGADRLTRTVTTSAAKSVATDFGLDAMANRLTETVTTTANGSAPTVSKRSSTYGSRNELKTIDDGSGVITTLNYDGEGNLTEKKQGSDSTIYRYNGNDNLISVARNGTTLGRYSNDHLGLRIEKEAKDPLQPGAPPVKLRTLWDGRNAFQDRDSGGEVIARYDNDGRHPVGMWHRDDGSQALHRDALGSIVATTDGSGKLKSEIVYDAFGNITEATGQSANKFGYTGHQMDAETGLVYFQARYYDPQLGRFITQDPYEGDWNTPLSLHHYLYAYGNPTTFVDLTGYYSVRQFGNDAAYYTGAAVGGVVGAPVGVAKAVYGTGAFIVDAGLAMGGNKGGADRMTERGKAVAEVLLQPRLVKDRIDASINVTVSKAAERRNAGNDFGAGLGLGFEGGEVAGPVVVGTLRFPKTEIPRIPGVERDSIPSKSPVKEAPRPPPTEAARSDAGITKEGPTKDISVEPAPSGTKTVVKPKTFITYEFKNAAGEVVYVGRASGKGTPEQVMKQRLAKGHDVYDANPGLIPEVRATQGSASANKGAEGVLYEQRMREGASLLNDPKSPPLSSKPAKAAEVREKISDYSEDLKH